MEKNFIKKIVKNVVKGVVLVSIVATCFSGCSQFKQKENQNQNNFTEDVVYSDVLETHKLPSEEEVNKKLQSFLGDEYEDYLLQENKLVRLPCPTGGESIKVNVQFEMDNKQKEIIEQSLEEYNYIFDVINPNYKFEVNYTPTEEDLNNPYNIDIRKVDGFEENQQGMARANIYTGNNSENIDGLETYNSYIEFTENCLNSPNAFMGTFKHEFGHLLGRGDAYNREDVDKDTIMNGGEKYGASLYSKYTSMQELDVAFIDAYYRSDDNIHSDEYINDFINNYEVESNFSYEDYQASKDFEVYKNLIQNIDIDELIEDIKKCDYDESVKEDLIKTLNETTKINTKLGSTQGALGECMKEENDYTYMSWDEKNNINITRKSYSGGSSGSRSMKEYGGMIRVGDAYSGKIMFGVGDYVFSYEYQKGYFDNDEVKLSEDFKNIYKLTDMTQEQYFNYINQMHNQYSNDKE